MRLYPKPPYREVMAFSTDDIDSIPDGIRDVMHLDLLGGFLSYNPGEARLDESCFFLLSLYPHMRKRSLRLKKDNV